MLHLEGNFSNEVAAQMFSPWRDSPDESPAGGLTGTGIHVLDSFVGMAGPVRRLHAQLLSHKSAPDPQDTLSVLLEFESGISGMRFSISETAKWGDVTVGPKIIDASVKKRMKSALKDIQSGKFAKNWVAEYKGGYKNYKALLKKGENHPIEKVGAKLRAMMPWIAENRLVDKSRN